MSATFNSDVASVVGLLIAPAAALVGPAASGASFERAQAAYQRRGRSQRADVRPGPLADAQKTLREAEQAKHSDERLHLSYLAEKKALLASVTGATGKTEQNMEQLRREASDVLLQKRDRELKAARTESDTKAREAEQWRRLAEARAKDDEAKPRPARPTDDAEAKALAAEQAKAAALASELARLKAQHTDRGMVLTVGDVLFAAGRAEVGPGAQRSIDKLAEFLRAYPKRNVVIEGHTDNLGNEDFNIKLSQQRADAVRDLLTARGISRSAFAPRGMVRSFRWSTTTRPPAVSRTAGSRWWC